MFIVPSRYYETSKNTASLEHPWKLRHDLLLDCLGWWPREDDTPRSDDPSIARHLRFAVSSPAYSVVTESEVDANPCWLIESPGRDRIWLDPAIGFAIRRRETSDKDTKALLRIQTSKDFQEQRFSADKETYTYWYPRQIIEESFEVSGTSKTQKSIIVEVLELRLNEVEDEAFEFQPPPGTIISNRDTGEINTLPGGRDLLDHTVTMASAILDLHPEKRIAQGHARDISLFVPMAIAGGAICIGVFMCWPILVRFWRIH